MLRFILRRDLRDPHSGMESSYHYTLDIDMPQLETHLTSGGFGGGGYDHHVLVGVEILDDHKKEL